MTGERKTAVALAEQPSVVNLTKLAAARSKMTPGEYEVWTSCSFRRITAAGGADGGVLRGSVAWHDGHPDLTGSNRDADLAGLVATHNAAPALVDVVWTALLLKAATSHRHAMAKAGNSVNDWVEACRAERAAAEAHDGALAKVSL